ncbi:deoxyribodipyrimidine photo-lyase [uncultured Devosia sp.]|uniref:cryptochrome/photolyase family protein n=1 Tax=uncultured Devosia sp. TaxID=211434 RepID=UPI0026037EF5|nr:deoxyribodipyrimidine photo-lyase [uncultured Devosia sp.]
MPTHLVWLRNDLRLSDNPALAAACRSGERIVALYIHETDDDMRAPGAAARWWLHHGLKALAGSLADIGVPLRVETGPARAVMDEVLRETGAEALHWNRRYAPADRRRDAEIKSALRDKDVTVTSYPGNVLVEPWDIETGQGKPYSVFTPFWKSLKEQHIDQPLARPSRRGDKIKAPAIDTGYEQPHWADKLVPYWTVGEASAQERLDIFLDQQVAGYPRDRDFPGVDATSRLSPHLRFGEISARQIWHATRAHAHAHPDKAAAIEKFLSELAWRDFSHHQLYHRHDIRQVPMQRKFQDLSWRKAPEQLRAWQMGRTGIPIIDAGMRELWETGYMHNRVRMLVASFLSKNLLIDWRLGEQWFWDCLVDADEANNPASWQWVAGCGLDAAPYFRIFNPVTQGERFDPNGTYVRRWVPEIAALPDKHIHDPSSAEADRLREAGVVPGETYPRAMVDLKATRARALEAFGALPSPG